MLVYICEKGFVIKQRPTNLRDYFRSAINLDDYYVYLYNVLWRLEGAFYPYMVQVADKGTT